MCKIPCPLCCEKSFINAEILRVALVEVTTKPLQCPLCNVICLGLDKLTIHLFTHCVLGNKTDREYRNLPEYTKNVLSISESIPNNTQTNNSQINHNLSISFDQNSEQFEVDNGNQFLTDGENQANVQAINQNQQNNNCTVVNKQQMTFLESQNCQQRVMQPSLITLPMNVSMQVGATVTQKENMLEIDTNIGNNQDIVNNKITNQTQQISPKFQLRPSPLETVVTRLTNGQTVLVPNKSKRNAEGATMDADGSGNQFSVANSSKTLCDLCGFHFDSVELLAMHAFIAHENNSSLTRMELHACGLCEKTFRMPAALLLHRSVIHDITAANQSKINSSSEKQVPLNSTVVITAPFSQGNDQKLWNCDICSKSFTTKYFLKKHKRLHTGEMPYSCTKCNKTFTFQQSYHKHLLYHNDEKPHACSHCGRTFKELSTLHNHQRIHTGEKPFACETCGKAFRQRVSYLVHRRIHTGAMPYKCTACNRSFRYKVSQRTHKCAAHIASNLARKQDDLIQKLLSDESSAQGTAQQLPPEPSPVSEIQSQLVNNAIDPPEITNIDHIVAESYDSMLLQTEDVCPNYTVTFQEDSPEPKNQAYEDVDVLTLYECSDSLETINEDALKNLLHQG